MLELDLHSRRDAATEISSLSLPLQVLYLCFDGIASHLPIITALSLSRTHTLLTDKLSSHLRRSFDGLLRSRISTHRIDAFRSLLLDTRAVISGSTALHFILRDTHWKPGDFDLYTPFGTGYALVRWLVANEGYTIVADGSKNFTFHPKTLPMPAGPCDWLTDLGLDFLPAAPRQSRSSIPHYGSLGADIYRVYKLTSGTNTFIDVIESSKPSFLPPITKFHSTLVMNYLTPNSVVILYPTLTFERQGILQSRNKRVFESYDEDPHTQASSPPAPIVDGGRKKKYVEKYEARGFTLYSRPADLRRPCGAACPARLRMVGNEVDKWCLAAHFDIPHKSLESSGIGTLSLETLQMSCPDNPEYTPTQGSIPLDPSSGSRPPSQWSWISSNLTAPSDTFAVSNASHAGQDQDGSAVASPPSNKVIQRPSLPPTTWVLNVKRPNARAVCTNPHCPLQGRRTRI